MKLKWTLSKILAYVVLLIGTIYAFWFQEANVLMAAFTAAGVIIAVKTATQSK